jgi:hypothetical protein
MATRLTRQAALRMLGLSPSEADENVIRRAYKTLALQHHPDVRSRPRLARVGSVCRPA